MSQAISAPAISCSDSDDRWHFLYRSAAFAALVTVTVFLFQIVAYFVWPPPSTVAGHFSLLRSRPLVGLVCLDFLIIVDEVLAILICLALYLSLRQVHESLMLIATAFSAASIVCYLIATPRLEYAVSHPPVHRGRNERGAGRASRSRSSGALRLWQGTPYQVGYVLGSIEMLLISW